MASAEPQTYLETAYCLVGTPISDEEGTCVSYAVPLRCAQDTVVDWEKSLCIVKTSDESAKREITALQRLSRELKEPAYTPQLLDFDNEHYQYLITSAIRGATLPDFLDVQPMTELPLGLRLHLLVELVRAVCECHRQSVSHGDLWGHNLMLDSENKDHYPPHPNLVLIDFGLACCDRDSEEWTTKANEDVIRLGDFCAAMFCPHCNFDVGLSTRDVSSGRCCVFAEGHRAADEFDMNLYLSFLHATRQNGTDDISVIQSYLPDLEAYRMKSSGDSPLHVSDNSPSVSEMKAALEHRTGGEQSMS